MAFLLPALVASVAGPLLGAMMEPPERYASGRGARRRGAPAALRRAASFRQGVGRALGGAVRAVPPHVRRGPSGLVAVRGHVARKGAGPMPRLRGPRHRVAPYIRRGPNGAPPEFVRGHLAANPGEGGRVLRGLAARKPRKAMRQARPLGGALAVMNKWPLLNRPLRYRQGGAAARRKLGGVNARAMALQLLGPRLAKLDPAEARAVAEMLVPRRMAMRDVPAWVPPPPSAAVGGRARRTTARRALGGALAVMNKWPLLNRPLRYRQGGAARRKLGGMNPIRRLPTAYEKRKLAAALGGLLAPAGGLLRPAGGRGLAQGRRPARKAAGRGPISNILGNLPLVGGLLSGILGPMGAIGLGARRRAPASMRKTGGRKMARRY